MLNYQTQLEYRPPVSPEMQADASRAMRSNVPRGMGQNAVDVYRSRAGTAMADYQRAADLANMNYLANFQKSQQGLALRGLQNMADEQQNNNQYQSAIAGSLLGGLFT